MAWFDGASPTNPRHTQIAIALLAGALVAGCGTSVIPTAPASRLSTSTPAPSASLSRAALSTALSGGCGATQVFSGPGPDAVGPDAIPGLEDLRWASASPAQDGIAAYFFRPPPDVLVVHPSLSGPDNKILWVTQGNLSGELVIEAHLTGATASTVHFKLPAAGRDYPSLIELPTPGCWELDLGSIGATIDLLVGPSGQGVGATPSAPWWAVGGLSACGRAAVYRLKGHLTYLGGCADNLGEPPATITMMVGEVLDLHMTTDVGAGPPLYPLPTSSDSSIVRLLATQDESTATFQAVGVGSAVLLTNGNCSSSEVSQFRGPCPALQVHVVSP